MPLLSRDTVNFRFADLARNEAPLLLHRDQRSRLRGQSVVRCGHRLVAVGERGRHNHVELKFARRNKTGERDRLAYASDNNDRSGIKRGRRNLALT